MAGKVMGGSGYGAIGDIIVGVAGALVGGFLAQNVLGLGDIVSGINLTTVLVAFLGAELVVVVAGLLSGRRRVT